MADESDESAAGPVFATFTLRVRALVIDSAVVAAGLAIIVVLSSFVDHVPGSGRVLVAAIFGLLFLYEPVLVWRYGATLGHHRTNIRVVSDSSGGPPSLPTSFARFYIKLFLGLPSFVTMAFTRRYQAFHDVLTGTTVQIRDLSLITEADCVEERHEGPDPNTPVPAWRRFLGILIYATLSFFVFGALFGMVLGAECLADDAACSANESIIVNVLSLVWLASIIMILVGGWRGRLPGFRRARTTHEATAV